jgi:hypothetical protein
MQGTMMTTISDNILEKKRGTDFLPFTKLKKMEHKFHHHF